MKFGISRKLVTVWELREICDLVANVLKCQENFPSNLKLQFMHKDVNKLIDLDSDTTSQPSNDEDESISTDHFIYVFLVFI